MKNLVIYDSYFGNTEKIAKIIAKETSAEIMKISDVKPARLKDLNLLIVGSPTRAFRPTPAITDLIKNLSNGSLDRVKITAFDTRADVDAIDNKFLIFMANIFGYAAKPIADRLAKKGGNLIIQPEGFLVTDSEGPLKKGEEERAREWAEKIKKAL